MKNVIRILICISISLLVLNCTTDETMPVQGKVQFTLAITSQSADGGRILSPSFPEGSYISLSIESSAGASVYSLTKIDLIKLGDGYITTPLELTEGNYRLTDFFVMSKAGEVLYATPKEGSALSKLVHHPLPVNFSIAPNGIINLNVQVVDATQQSPADFGYVSFDIEVVKSDFSISVFTGEVNNLSYTSATLRLYQGIELIYTQSLQAKVNPVNFNGDGNATYTLVVEKEGYTLKSKEYVLHTLLEELNGSPLAILLEPASTFKVLVKEPSQLGLRLATNSEDIFIDWGDGVVEHAMITSGYFTELLHNYDSTGRYFVNITGGLNTITEYEFTFINYNSVAVQDIESIDITQLSELKSFILSWRTIPKEINFSRNTRLEFMDVSMSNMAELDITNNPHLNFLNVESTYLIPHDNPENVSRITDIINALTQHTIANNIQGGTFAYGGSWGGPLPDDSTAKLIMLKRDYGWNIHPTPNE